MIGAHIALVLAELCSSSTGVPAPAASIALRRIGRAEGGMPALLSRHARACRGHPRLSFAGSKAWMAGTSPAMTGKVFVLLRRDARGGLGPLHLGGAIFELGDFSERVERWVSQEVGRRLDEGEGNEHDAVGHAVVLASGELDRAAAGGHADHVTGRDA